MGGLGAAGNLQESRLSIAMFILPEGHVYAIVKAIASDLDHHLFHGFVESLFFLTFHDFPSGIHQKWGIGDTYVFDCFCWGRRALSKSKFATHGNISPCWLIFFEPRLVEKKAPGQALSDVDNDGRTPLGLAVLVAWLFFLGWVHFFNADQGKLWGNLQQKRRM